VVVLQHPRERRVGIGTARMAHLCLPNSLLRVGIDFADDAEVTRALAGGAFLLFPGPVAHDLHTLPAHARPGTLVVVDGTWSQARKLVHRNPMLAALPRVAFVPQKVSDYHAIRREPAPHCVSTIEALAEVLAVLEPDAAPFRNLLDPLHALVARQRWYAREVRASRHRAHAARVRSRPHRPGLAERLAAEWPHLVCVQGEANGWSVRDPARQEPELVHFVAYRPATGARFEAVIAPRRPLAPFTPNHVELPAAQLLGGGSLAAFCDAWRAFVQPDDVLVKWGHFYTRLAQADGAVLPAAAIDLRAELKQVHGRRAGALEDWAGRLAAQPSALGLPGRGGRRLATLVALLAMLARPDVPADG
jgi:DTW domain-containing protein YfiP